MNGCKISELEDILGVSRQAIYDKLKQDKYKAYVRKIKGIKVVSPEGVKALKQEYGVESFCKGSKAEECITLNCECKENQGCKADSSEDCKDNQGFKDESGENCKDFKGEFEELKHLREENKRLLALVEQQNTLMHQQNQLLLNSQMLQQKALNNTEILLIEKQKELEKRKQNYTKKQSWLRRLFRL